LAHDHDLGSGRHVVVGLEVGHPVVVDAEALGGPFFDDFLTNMPHMQSGI
jgi:hypothetical protein